LGYVAAHDGGNIFCDYLFKDASQKGVFKMKNTVKILGIIVLAAIVGFSMVGCNRSGDTPDTDRLAASAASGTGGGNAVMFLDEYEKIIDEYVDLMKKLMAGDMTVMGQIDALGTRTQEMAMQFGNISEDDFSPAQKQRYEELNQRLENAFSF
jgi:hypothetical protein